MENPLLMPPPTTLKSWTRTSYLRPKCRSPLTGKIQARLSSSLRRIPLLFHSRPSHLISLTCPICGQNPKVEDPSYSRFLPLNRASSRTSPRTSLSKLSFPKFNKRQLIPEAIFVSGGSIIGGSFAIRIPLSRCYARPITSEQSFWTILMRWMAVCNPLIPTEGHIALMLLRVVPTRSVLFVPWAGPWSITDSAGMSPGL